jgi:hypothetical protein
MDGTSCNPLSSASPMEPVPVSTKGFNRAYGFTGNHWTSRCYGYERHSIADERGTEIGFAHHRRDARLIAAAPELLEAAHKHVEWIEEERNGPNYSGLTRDTHPNGEAIWRDWWDSQLELCAETEALARAAINKALGKDAA